jgi:large subunit ribosomal protein L45
VHRTLKLTDLASPELLAEPYAGPRPSLPFLTSWFTPTGWRARYYNILSEVKNLYALARCTKDISGFSMRTFKTEVLELYKNVNRLFAAGELTLLKRQATSKCFGLMKKEIKVRESGGKWAKVSWGLAEEPRLSNVELLQARLLALDPNNPKTHFAQLTVSITTKHTFAAYDKNGRIVAGDPEASVSVKDVWVVERALVNQQGRWILAARLTI